MTDLNEPFLIEDINMAERCTAQHHWSPEKPKETIAPLTLTTVTYYQKTKPWKLLVGI